MLPRSNTTTKKGPSRPKGKQKKDKGGKQASSTLVKKDLGKQASSALVEKDLLIRRALHAFFSEGEAQPLKQFCTQFSQVHYAIQEELAGNAGLCELRDQRDKRDGAEADESKKGFTKEECHKAVEHINATYSDKYASRNRKKKKFDPATDNEKGYFPPLENSYGTCTGLGAHPTLKKYLERVHLDRNVLLVEVKLSYFREKWRSQNCLVTAVLDNQGRCSKCKNTYKNISRSRTPQLFEDLVDPKTKTFADIILPSTLHLQNSIQAHLDSIEMDAVPTDKNMILATKVLKVMGLPKLELRGGKDFKEFLIACEDCGIPMVKRDRKDMSMICTKCNRKKSSQAVNQKRKESNREDRVNPNGHTPFSVLTMEEATERYSKLKKLYKDARKKLAKVDAINVKGKGPAKRYAAEAKAKKISVQTDSYIRTPLLPWPFYLNYNPMTVRDYTPPTAAAGLGTTSVARAPKVKGRAKPAAKGEGESVLAQGDHHVGNVPKASPKERPGGSVHPGSEDRPLPSPDGDVAEALAEELLEEASVEIEEDAPVDEDEGNIAANGEGACDFDGHLV